MTIGLVVSAVMAITQCKSDGIVHQSDQGAYWTGIPCGEHCAKLGVRPSIGSVGDTDNMMSEGRETDRSDRKGD